VLNDSLIGFPKDGVVYCRFWSDECVIFNQVSGETHLINGIGALIFRLISEKPLTRTVLLQNIQNIFEFEIDTSVEELLDNLVFEYQKLGLLD
jgi:PqqD family protein of HPr-rel-A system